MCDHATFLFLFIFLLLFVGRVVEEKSDEITAAKHVSFFFFFPLSLSLSLSFCLCLVAIAGEKKKKRKKKKKKKVGMRKLEPTRIACSEFRHLTDQCRAR